MKRKKNTLLYLNCDLVERAKKENINISRLAEDALKKALDIRRPVTVKQHIQRMLEETGSQGSFYGETYLLPLQIESLTLSNIGPFGRFGSKFSRDGINAICGPNGSGKSTIVRSILYAFGRRHRYFSDRATNGGTIKLRLFPGQTSIDITDATNHENGTKGYGCLVADDPFSRLRKNMIVPLIKQLNCLGIQIIITASLLVNPTTFPENTHVISLYDYPHYR